MALALASLGTKLILPTVLQISNGRLIEDAVNLGYPLGDVTLLVFVVVAFARYSWRPDRMWLYLGAAMVVDAVADLIYVYLAAKGTYVSGRHPGHDVAGRDGSVRHGRLATDQAPCPPARRSPSRSSSCRWASSSWP